MTPSPEAVALVEDVQNAGHLCAVHNTAAKYHDCEVASTTLLAHIAAVEDRARTAEAAIRAALGEIDEIPLSDGLRNLDAIHRIVTGLRAALEKP